MCEDLFDHLVLLQVIEQDGCLIAFEVADHIGIIRVGSAVVERDDAEAVVPVHLFLQFKDACFAVLVVKFHLHTVHHAGIATQVTLLVEIVSLNGVGGIAILIKLLQVASHHIQFEGFKDLGIFPIHGDDDVILLILEEGEDHCPHILKRSQVKGIAPVQIGRIDMVVLVATPVHHVEETLIIDPAIAFDWLLFLLDDTCNLPGGDLPDVDMVLQSLLLHVGEIPAIGREPEGGSVWTCKIITYAVAVFTFV